MMNDLNLKFFSSAILILILSACSSEPSVDNPDDFTGNEITYPLASGSNYNITGFVVLKEKKDGFTTVNIELSGMSGTEGLEFPVHLHFGNITTDNAEIAALLSPVNGKTWKSSTILKMLANETQITYSELLNFDASIKIHFSATGVNKDIILSAGNIGSAQDVTDPSGRFSIAICKSE
jgi:hypothetical protein